MENKLEGSCQTTKSSVKAHLAPSKKLSTGVHLTVRERDAQRAAKYQVARTHYHTRSAYWAKPSS